MKPLTTTIFALVTSVLVAACFSKPADVDFDAGPFDAASGVPCETNSSCAVDLPVCNPSTHVCDVCMNEDDCATRTATPHCATATGACVECRDSGDCSGGTPFCDADACRACRADNECASGACDLEQGTCADEADVIYVSTTGQASGTCTSTTPCTTFALGLAQVTSTRNVIKVAPGTYTGQVDLNGVTVTVLGDGATIMQASTAAALVVRNGADVTIEGLAITGGGIGVSCDPLGGNIPTLRLHRAAVVGNAVGGIIISNCQFSLVNDVIALNGTVTSAFGGVSLNQISIATGTLHELAFDTITKNGCASGNVSGLACGGIAVSIVMASDIVYGNQVSGGGTQTGGDPQCTFTYSDVGPDTVAGTGNINASPAFVDDTSNFHLMQGSPAQDTADPAATISIDIDGDGRPQGAGDDMGADEVVP